MATLFNQPVVRVIRLLGVVLLASLVLVLLASRAQSLAPGDPLVSVGSFAPFPAPPAPEQVRLVTYNLHGPPTKRIDDIIDVLRNHDALEDAAILGLQEVNRHHDETAYKDMARELANALDMHYAYAVELPIRGEAVNAGWPS